MLIQLKILTYKVVLLSMALGLLGSTIALAASGDLDTTFDGDGLVTSFASPANPGRSDDAAAIAIQADGKIVVAGSSVLLTTFLSDYAVIRYNPNGSLDTTFSGDGRLLTNFGGRDEAHDVAVQANGKVVVVGEACDDTYSNCDLALARYNSNGTLDTTFSGDGKQTTDFAGGNNGSLGGVAIQADGKIVVAGYGGNNNFAVYRYNSNGSLDTTFSGDGLVSFGFGAGWNAVAHDLAIQSDGKIVVVGCTGYSEFGGSTANFAIARLNSSGSLDLTFSGDGKKTTDFGAYDCAHSVSLQVDGKIVAAGEKFVGGDDFQWYAFALARYNTDGSLDTTFNGTGRKTFEFFGVDSSAHAVITQSDGKIIVLGGAWNTSNQSDDFALARLNSGGSFDTTFSGDGKLLIDFGGYEYGFAIALQPSDGKYVLAGATSEEFNPDRDFALARVLP